MALTNCPNCGHMVSDLAPKCPECGMVVNQELSSQTVFCAYCGEKMDSSFSFCPKCGRNVKKNSSQDILSKRNIKTDYRDLDRILVPLLAPLFSIGLFSVVDAMQNNMSLIMPQNMPQIVQEIVQLMLNRTFVFLMLLAICFFGLFASFNYTGKRTSLKVIAIILNLIMIISYSPYFINLFYKKLN